MPIYKRGASYLASVGSGPDRVRKTFKTLEDAERWEKKELLIRDGTIDRPADMPKKGTAAPRSGTGYSLDDAYRLTVKDHWSQRKTEAGAKNAQRVIRYLGKDTLVSEVTTSLIREMVTEWEDMGNTGSTVNHKLSALSMMLKTAADEGWIEALPRIARRSPGTHRIRWLDAEAELEVLNACDHLGLLALKDYIVCAVDTGFRRGELIDFQIKHYYDGRLHLHPDETKTSRARSVPATQRVHDVITKRSHMKGLFDDMSRYSLREHWNLMREYLNKSEDPQFVVHMLRHTCASRLAMQDKSAQFIQAWMGHATPLTTARYMHLAPGKLKEGVEALEEYRKKHTPILRAV